MKQRALFLCILLLAVSLNSFAQANNMYLGPEGGPGLSLLWGNSTLNQSRLPAVAGTAGYAFQYNFTKIFSIRTDLSYERAGTDYVNYLVLTTSTERSKFDYMTLPILARATFGKKVNFFINAGPYMGILLREVDVAEDGSSTKIYEHNTGFFKRFDTGITEGLGILIPIGTSYAVSFEARNNTGLYNIERHQLYPMGNNIMNNTTNFIFAFIYKLVTRKPAAKQKT